MQGRRQVIELGGGGVSGGESERGRLSLFVSRMLLPSFVFLNQKIGGGGLNPHAPLAYALEMECL